MISFQMLRAITSAVNNVHESASEFENQHDTDNFIHSPKNAKKVRNPQVTGQSQLSSQYITKKLFEEDEASLNGSEVIDVLSFPIEEVSGGVSESKSSSVADAICVVTNKRIELFRINRLDQAKEKEQPCVTRKVVTIIKDDDEEHDPQAFITCACVSKGCDSTYILIGDSSSNVHIVSMEGKVFFSYGLLASEKNDTDFTNSSSHDSNFQTITKMWHHEKSKCLFVASGNGDVSLFSNFLPQSLHEACIKNDGKALLALRKSLQKYFVANVASPVISIWVQEYTKFEHATFLRVALGCEDAIVVHKGMLSSDAPGRAFTLDDQYAFEDACDSISNVKAKKIIHIVEKEWCVVLDSEGRLLWYDTQYFLLLGVWKHQDEPTRVMDFINLHYPRGTSLKPRLVILCDKNNDMHLQMQELSLEPDADRFHQIVSELPLPDTGLNSQHLAVQNSYSSWGSFYSLTKDSGMNDQEEYRDSAQRFLHVHDEAVPLQRLNMLIQSQSYDAAFEYAQKNNFDVDPIWISKCERAASFIQACCNDASVSGDTCESHLHELMSCLKQVKDASYVVQMCVDPLKFSNHNVIGTLLKFLEEFVARLEDSGKTQESAISEKNFELTQKIMRRWKSYNYIFTSKNFQWNLWCKFSKASLFDIVRLMFVRHKVPEAIALWRRHRSELSVKRNSKLVMSLLRQIPAETLPSHYISWLQNEILPTLDMDYLHEFQLWCCETATQIACILKDAKGALDLLDILVSQNLHLRSKVRNISLLHITESPAPLLGCHWSSIENQIVDKTVPRRSKFEIEDQVLILHRQLQEVNYLNNDRCMVNMTLETLKSMSLIEVAAKMLDRIAAPGLLRKELDAHVQPFLDRHAVQLDAFLTQYMDNIMSCQSFVSDSIVEKRLIAVIYCIQSDNARINACLRFLGRIRPPYSVETRTLLSKTSQWGGQYQEKISEQKRLMDLYVIFSKYNVDITAFNFSNTYHARMLYNHIVHQVHKKSALEDLLILVEAYSAIFNSHNCYVDYMQNLILFCNPSDVENLNNCPYASLRSRVQRCVQVLEKLDICDAVVIAEEMVQFCITMLEDYGIMEVSTAIDILKLHNVSKSSKKKPCTEHDHESGCHWQFLVLLDAGISMQSFLKHNHENFDGEMEATYQNLISVMKIRNKYKICLSLSSFTCLNFSNKFMSQAVSLYCKRGTDIQNVDITNLRQLSALFCNSTCCVLEKMMELCTSLGDAAHVLKICDANYAQNPKCAQTSGNLHKVLHVLVSRLPVLIEEGREKAKFDSFCRSVNALSSKELTLCSAKNINRALNIFKSSAMIYDIFSKSELGDYSNMWDEKQSDHAQSKNSNFIAKTNSEFNYYQDNILVLDSKKSMQLLKKVVSAMLNETDDMDCFSDLAAFLSNNGGDQLALNAVCNALPPLGSKLWKKKEAGHSALLKLILRKLLKSQVIDSHLAIGYMLSLPKEDAFTPFRKNLRTYGTFARLLELSKIGCEVASVWGEEKFLKECKQLTRNAYWWHLLSSEHSIAINRLNFREDTEDGKQYIKSLIPMMVKKGVDRDTLFQFASSYGLKYDFVLSRYITLQIVTPMEAYKTNIKCAIKDDIHPGALMELREALVDKIPGTDYDRLQFLFEITHVKIPQVLDTRRCISILNILKKYTASEVVSDGKIINFHDLLKNPWSIIRGHINERSLKFLIGLSYPCKLDSDNFYEYIIRHKIGTAIEVSNGEESLPVYHFQECFDYLDDISSCTMKIKLAEWLSERCQHHGKMRVKILKFALQCARIDSSCEEVGMDKIDNLNAKLKEAETTHCLKKFFGLNRSLSSRSCNFSALQKFIRHPKELIYCLYHEYSVPLSRQNGNKYDVHALVFDIGEQHSLNVMDIRRFLVKFWLKNGNVSPLHQNTHCDIDLSGGFSGASCFFDSCSNKLAENDEEETMLRISYTLSCPFSSSTNKKRCQFLLNFGLQSNESRVSYKSRSRAMMVAFHLASSDELSELASSLGKSAQDLYQHWQYCDYMVMFNRLRISYSMKRLVSCDKLALVRGLWRNHQHQDNTEIMHLLSAIMIDFDINDVQLWEGVLNQMWSKRMFVELFLILKKLSHFECISKSGPRISNLWGQILLRPFEEWKIVASGKIDTNQIEMRDKCFEEIIDILSICPFLDCIDVLPFVKRFSENGLMKLAAKCSLLASTHDSRKRCIDLLETKDAYVELLDELLCYNPFFGNETASLDDTKNVLSDGGFSSLVAMVLDRVDGQNKHSVLYGTQHWSLLVHYTIIKKNVENIVGSLKRIGKVDVALEILENHHRYNPECMDFSQMAELQNMM